MKKLDLRLLRLIKNSKGQFIAITVLIIIGLIIYTGLSMAAINLEESIDTYFNRMNFSDLFIEAVELSDGDIEKIQQITDVSKVEGRIVVDVPFKDEDQDAKVRLISQGKDKEINKLYTVKGDKNIEKKEVLMLKQFAEARSLDVGNDITLEIGGKDIIFTIKGIVSSPEYIYLMEDEQSLLPTPKKFGVVYMDEKYLEEILGYSGVYTEALVTSKNTENLEVLKEEIEDQMKGSKIRRIYPREDQLSNRMVHEEIKGLKQVSSTIPLLFLGVAGIIIAALISRMIRNDRMSIGVMKSLGYNNRKILAHYTKLSLSLGLIGSVIGILLGSLLANQMAKMYLNFFNIPFLEGRFYPEFTLYGIILSVMFCVLAGLWGARKVLKIDPAESMRPDPPKKGGRVFVDRIGFLWRRLNFSEKMVFRNIFRNKKRFIFLSLGIAITFSIVIMPFAMLDAMNTMFDKHYTDFQLMEYNINFNRPMTGDVIEDIKEELQIGKIENKIEYPFEIINEEKEKVVTIIGLEENTEFYDFTSVKGDDIELPKKGILLSEGLAKVLDLEEGDNIEIKTFNNDENIKVEVKGIIRQSLGSNGYMNISQMREEFIGSNITTGVYINSDEDVKNRLDDLEYVSFIQSTKDMINIYMEFTDLIILSLGIMLLAGGILGFVIIYNSTIMNIAERRLEFSSLRVLGLSKKEIFKIVTKENAIMTITGILLGIPLGLYMIKYLESMYSTDIYTLRVDISLLSYLGSILATVIFVIIAQLATYRKIKNLDFIEALKNRIT
ncbi:FtsX-like permease family protein [Clostridium sp. D2Q-11]|uniref:FtsX-like permease family protein n=1 Tax=Anaeromonas frigoriresistens TaxID=2683708 RepID=A0A942USA4_9FIRM|nr:FtsX-like permease family protein [Anaeromonas frigoriresistens]MBS4537015.1 FtsX-like permease family protein [Anaeromonas frigoriresistens]